MNKLFITAIAFTSFTGYCLASSTQAASPAASPAATPAASTQVSKSAVDAKPGAKSETMKTEHTAKAPVSSAAVTASNPTGSTAKAASTTMSAPTAASTAKAVPATPAAPTAPAKHVSVNSISKNPALNVKADEKLPKAGTTHASLDTSSHAKNANKKGTVPGNAGQNRTGSSSGIDSTKKA